MKSSTQNKAASSGSSLVRYYLVLYNVFSAIGWSYVLVASVIHLAGLTDLSRLASVTSTPTAKSVLLRYLSKISFLQSALPLSAKIESLLPPTLIPILDRAKTTFTAVGWQTAVVQSFAVLEILHSALGWVRSPLTTTAAQVASRVILVWGIADKYEAARFNPIYASMVLSWSITEIIRYTFYAANKLGYEPKWLVWLRYTTFYVLYPTGAGSEAALIFSTLPSHNAWSEADYGRALMFLIWWPGLYIMYTYMIQQRKKVLGRGQRLGKTKTN
ncbi:hypothetical protein M422DRAFT_205249 [Sphaerobolus stellatus SS14]|nr:hypothetical protein M422DRAFT_205249 [Sphaerobolus stellatus SS14]